VVVEELGEMELLQLVEIQEHRVVVEDQRVEHLLVELEIELLVHQRLYQHKEILVAKHLVLMVVEEVVVLEDLEAIILQYHHILQEDLEDLELHLLFQEHQQLMRLVAAVDGVVVVEAQPQALVELQRPE